MGVGSGGGVVARAVRRQGFEGGPDRGLRPVEIAFDEQPRHETSVEDEGGRQHADLPCLRDRAVAVEQHGKSARRVLKKARTRRSTSATSTATMASGRPCVAASVAAELISRTQGSHQVAEKCTSTVVPAKLCSARVSFSSDRAARRTAARHRARLSARERPAEQPRRPDVRLPAWRRRKAAAERQRDRGGGEAAQQGADEEGTTRAGTPGTAAARPCRDRPVAKFLAPTRGSGVCAAAHGVTVLRTPPSAQVISAPGRFACDEMTRHQNRLKPIREIYIQND